MTHFNKIVHNADLCVVGGGMSGICAAIAAARNGKKVVLMHERPMFGGNASSEIRMWICGAGGKGNRETGILEDIALENIYRNPYKTWPIWDSVLFEAVKNEKNIEVLLNCSCMDGETENDRIISITGWQMTTQTFHCVKAKIFADCSGDSVLAPISGALYRVGREAASEFGENLGKEKADKKTMGMSCLIQAREMNEKRDFIPPLNAKIFDEKSINNRIPHLNNLFENFWYLELGGNEDSIADTEKTRDELINIAYGVWDFLKNKRSGNENWELDFVGYLPGRRESRRYVGDVILNQNDLEKGFKYQDTVAFGGWPMDDHPPEGFYAEYPNKNTMPAVPYSIPYRTLYSVNIKNLMFAGRNISATHTALSSTRVMATCAVMGQALGTAAAMAAEYNCSPRKIYENHIDELQQKLICDDCYLPDIEMQIPNLTKKATLKSDLNDYENLVNGKDRSVFTNNGKINNYAYGKEGSYAEFSFETPENVNTLRLLFDSRLERGLENDAHLKLSTYANVPLNQQKQELPPCLVREFKVEVFDENENIINVFEEKNNKRRLVKIPINKKIKRIKITLEKSGEDGMVRLFSALIS